MTRRHTPPALEGMQTAPGFWPVRGAAANQLGNQAGPASSGAALTAPIREGEFAEYPPVPSAHLRDSAENFAREMTLLAHGKDATEADMRRVSRIVCESMLPKTAPREGEK